MNQLIQYDIDYRIIYTHEEEFFNHVKNSYHYKQSTKEPPVFHHILEDLVTIEMKLFVERYPEIFADISLSERDNLLLAIEAEDPQALNYVAEKIDRNYIELFARDLHLFLTHNHWFFFEKDPYSNDYLAIFNSPLVDVW